MFHLFVERFTEARWRWYSFIGLNDIGIRVSPTAMSLRKCLVYLIAFVVFEIGATSLQIFGWEFVFALQIGSWIIDCYLFQRLGHLCPRKIILLLLWTSDLINLFLIVLLNQKNYTKNCITYTCPFLVVILPLSWGIQKFDICFLREWPIHIDLLLSDDLSLLRCSVLLLIVVSCALDSRSAYKYLLKRFTYWLI